MRKTQKQIIEKAKKDPAFPGQCVQSLENESLYAGDYKRVYRFIVHYRNESPKDINEYIKRICQFIKEHCIYAKDYHFFIRYALDIGDEIPIERKIHRVNQILTISKSQRWDIFLRVLRKLNDIECEQKISALLDFMMENINKAEIETFERNLLVLLSEAEFDYVPIKKEFEYIIHLMLLFAKTGMQLPGKAKRWFYYDDFLDLDEDMPSENSKYLDNALFFIRYHIPLDIVKDNNCCIPGELENRVQLQKELYQKHFISVPTRSLSANSPGIMELCENPKIWKYTGKVTLDDAYMSIARVESGYGAFNFFIEQLWGVSIIDYKDDDIDIFPTNPGTYIGYDLFVPTKITADFTPDIYIRKVRKKNYQMLNASRYHPLTIKEMAMLYEEENKNIVAFFQYLEEICLANKKYIIKDIMKYVKKGMFLPSVTLKEALECHNFNELFQKKYPVNANWNKKDVNALYLAYRLSPYVKDKQKNKLMNIINNQNLYEQKNELLEDFRTRLGRKQCLATLIGNYYCKKLSINEYDRVLINDWIKMSFDARQKISLSKNSLKKIKEEHDELSVKIELKRIGPIKIPKSSRFHKLRKMLPPEFEWIKDQKRLIKEGRKMHHCVASYALQIKQDECAIYSFVYKPEQKRYTIEFHKGKGHYYINQMQSAYNNGCSQNARAYVQSFLEQQ